MSRPRWQLLSAGTRLAVGWAAIILGAAVVALYLGLLAVLSDIKPLRGVVLGAVLIVAGSLLARSGRRVQRR